MRVIYEVHAKVIDANGTYNNLTNYPAVFDSIHYDNDAEKTERRANASYNDALSSMYRNDSRMLQVAFIININNGQEIAKTVIGVIE